MKLIGIVGRTYYNKDNQDIIQFNDVIRRSISRYDDVVCIGILPTNNICYNDIEMGNDSILDEDIDKLNFILNKCDGFIIPGGSSWYKFDEYVIKYAIDNDKSVLAICAGFQCLCSMFASNRTKFDMTEKLGDSSHFGDSSVYIHNNSVLDNSLLKNIIGKDNLMVNSVHNDYINFDMNDLVVSSYSDDGVVEAVEMTNKKFILGVQWHPEYLMDDDSIRILDSFIDSIKK